MNKKPMLYIYIYIFLAAQDVRSKVFSFGKEEAVPVRHYKIKKKKKKEKNLHPARNTIGLRKKLRLRSRTRSCGFSPMRYTRRCAKYYIDTRAERKKT